MKSLNKYLIVIMLLLCFSQLGASSPNVDETNPNRKNFVGTALDLSKGPEYRSFPRWTIYYERTVFQTGTFKLIPHLGLGYVFSKFGTGKPYGVLYDALLGFDLGNHNIMAHGEIGILGNQSDPEESIKICGGPKVKVFKFLFAEFLLGGVYNSKNDSQNYFGKEKVVLRSVDLLITFKLSINV